MARFVRPWLSTVALALATLLPAAAPAQTVNLHNGVIVIRNNTGARLMITINPGPQENFYIYPGKQWISSACCFAAGTHYAIGYIAQHQQYYHRYILIPKLCNRNGIPYGYGDIEIRYTRDGHGDYEVDRLDGSGCYPG